MQLAVDVLVLKDLYSNCLVRLDLAFEFAVAGLED